MTIKVNKDCCKIQMIFPISDASIMTNQRRINLEFYCSVMNHFDSNRIMTRLIDNLHISVEYRHRYKILNILSSSPVLVDTSAAITTATIFILSHLLPLCAVK